MRGDAERNRDSIMAVAKHLIAEQGADVSMQSIASGAGLAVGTLYRHHPTKADLVAAVIADSAERIASLAEDAAAAIAAGAEPGRRLRDLLRTIAARSAENQALRAAARSLGVASDRYVAETPPPPDSPIARTFAAFDAILDAARRAEVIRPDVHRRDLTVLLHGVFELPLDEANRSRYIDIVLAGLALPLDDSAIAVGTQAGRG
jgi:AcrR family transcriptional regulator